MGCRRHRWRFMGGGMPRWSGDEVCLTCKKRRTRMLFPDECFGISLFVGYKPKSSAWLERNRYRAVEPGVRGAVRKLARAGIRTVWSCDGTQRTVDRPSCRGGVPCVVCVGNEADRKRTRELVGGRIVAATHTPRLFQRLLPKGTFYVWWRKARKDKQALAAGRPVC